MSNATINMVAEIKEMSYGIVESMVRRLPGFEKVKNHGLYFHRNTPNGLPNMEKSNYVLSTIGCGISNASFTLKKDTPSFRYAIKLQQWQQYDLDYP